MSPQLKQFLAEWLAWAEGGAPDHPAFQRWCGLCNNLTEWHFLGDRASREPYAGPELKRLLALEFENTGYPFGGGARYLRDMTRNEAHRNVARRKWVRKQLETDDDA